MPRSQLLIDAVSSNVTLENILLRLKVILSDLDNENIMTWINGELEGYTDSEIEKLPPYRRIEGELFGTFLVNYNFQYKNAPVPIHSLISQERIDQLTEVTVTDSVSTLQTIARGKSNGNYGKIIPTSLCHVMSTGELQIANMTAKIGPNQLDRIVSKVKSKLIDIIMELEKQFENLDGMDIRSQLQEKDSTGQVIVNIENIIYDGSVNLGDKNKIGKTRIGHWFGGKEKG